MQGYLWTETLPALGKGQQQEAPGSPELSGTPTSPSGAGTARAGTWESHLPLSELHSQGL